MTRTATVAMDPQLDTETHEEMLGEMAGRL